MLLCSQKNPLLNAHILLQSSNSPEQYTCTLQHYQIPSLVYEAIQYICLQQNQLLHNVKYQHYGKYGLSYFRQENLQQHSSFKQATDRVVQSMVIQLLRQGILLIPLMWILNYFLHIIGIWIAFPITELIVCSLALFFMKRNKIEI